jgi:hypothetical protein
VQEQHELWHLFSLLFDCLGLIAVNFYLSLFRFRKRHEYLSPHPRRTTGDKKDNKFSKNCLPSDQECQILFEG